MDEDPDRETLEEWLSPGRKCHANTLSRSVSSLLLDREIGLRPAQSFKHLNHRKNLIYDTLGPSMYYMGASGSVGSVAWAPDNNIFACGSASLADENSIHYNLPNNLLLGDYQRKIVFEKSDHKLKRPIPKPICSSLLQLQNPAEDHVFTTVSQIAFSPDGRILYSAGYDCCVRTWDPQNLHEGYTSFINLGSEVDLIHVSPTGLLATGCRRRQKSVRVFSCSLDNWKCHRSFSSPRASESKEEYLFPSALKWGIHPIDRNFLVVGFSAFDKVDYHSRTGDVCVWNIQSDLPVKISSSSHSVFDVAWSPYGGQFALASVPLSYSKRASGTMISLHESLCRERHHVTSELIIPAQDINDIVYSRHDPCIISASCTDGSVYVYDVRNPSTMLQKLSHDEPITPLSAELSREHADSGVTFLSWGENRNRLFSGSSDGVLKSWDVYRAPEDCLVKDNVRFKSGIMSGVFSGDCARLIIGEDSGTINVLEIGNENRPLRDAEQFLLHSSLSPDHSSSYRKSAALPQPDADLCESSDLTRKQKISDLFTTDDEVEDSGRSADRIPHSLMYSWKSGLGMTTRSGSGAKCEICGRKARLRFDLSSNLLPVRCEICSFSCIRCGAQCKVFGLNDMIRCFKCATTWTYDCLGYRRLNQKRKRDPHSSHRGPSTHSSGSSPRSRTGLPRNRLGLEHNGNTATGWGNANLSLLPNPAGRSDISGGSCKSNFGLPGDISADHSSRQPQPEASSDHRDTRYRGSVIDEEEFASVDLLREIQDHFLDLWGG